MNTTGDIREGFSLNDDGEWIPDGWTNSPLNQVVSDFIDYRGKTPKKTNSGIPLITAKVVKEGRVLQTEEFIDESEYEAWMRRGIPKEGDVILTTEAPLGEVAFIPKGKIALAQRIITLRGKTGKLDNGFLKYSLQSPLMQYRLTARESGSTVSGIKSSELKVTDLLHPEDLNEQVAIASVLNSLDNKIELLREQNQTLQALAQSLFKRWFIDFNFPDENGNPYKDSGGKVIASELGEIPEGWKVGKLIEVCDIYDSRRIPLSKKQREQRKGKYPYYGATSIMDHVDDFLFEGVHLLLAEDGSVIREDKTPFLQYVWGEFWVNNHAHVLSGKNGFSTEMLYLKFKKTNVSDLITGAVQLKINQGNLMGSELVIPPVDVESNFTRLSARIFEKIRINSEQIQTLTQLRDTLLPKLMKGEIRVPVES